MKLEDYFKNGKIPMLKDYRKSLKEYPYMPEITSLCKKVVKLPR